MWGGGCDEVNNRCAGVDCRVVCICLGPCCGPRGLTFAYEGNQGEIKKQDFLVLVYDSRYKSWIGPYALT